MSGAGPGDAAWPPARGRRMTWRALPPEVRAAVQRRVGAPVLRARSRPAGFSPGLAARLTFGSGERLFLKAVGTVPNEEAPGIHRREARVSAALPPEVLAPRLLWSLDQGPGGWVVLAFEDVGGRLPRLPWRPGELARVLGAVAAMHVVLTPSPVEAPDAGNVMDREVSGWRALARERPSGLDAWSARHLDLLCRLEDGVATAVVGRTLLHMDLRADNLLLTDRGVFVVDWPHAAVGASWLDVVALAPSVAMQGGPPPERVLAADPTAAVADPGAIDSAVAALAGYFTRGALSAPPPGLPTLRAFQAGQGAQARRWLARRLDLEAPGGHG